MNELLKGLKVASNMSKTLNGADTYKSTLNKVYDLFAQGAAMRNANDNDCIFMFKNAYDEDPNLALKCLFYLRDIRGGQGERRFFRVCLRWLAQAYTAEAEHLIPYVAEYGRWDDLYTFVDTPAQVAAFNFMKKQLTLDLGSKTPSLLAKWLKSENASSKETRLLGYRTRMAFGISSRQYRKALSLLREKIKLVETLMSQNRWDEIEFDKLPSRAGFIYKNAFARHDITKERYERFIKDENTKVNAGTLYPYDVVHEAAELFHSRYSWFCSKPDIALDNIDRLTINKYWDNLTDYFNEATFNGLAVVDTSGSMTCGSNIIPIDVAISLGLYCAERAHGPFHNHFISFSRKPQLIEVEGIDFCDKVHRIYKQNLCENTNIEATFDLILNVARMSHLRQNDLPENLIIISDMQFDEARGEYRYWHSEEDTNVKSMMEKIKSRWEYFGYKMPKLIFWNVNAVHGNNIPMKDEDGITYVSGASPVIFEMIMSGKTSQALMLDKLLSNRYNDITSIRAK